MYRQTSSVLPRQQAALDSSGITVQVTDEVRVLAGRLVRGITRCDHASSGIPGRPVVPPATDETVFS